MKWIRLTRLALLLAAVTFPVAAVVIGGGYIAGDGFTLAQAVADAKREHGPGSSSAFWLLVRAPEIEGLARASNDPALAADLQEVQRRGGVIFVCRQDLSGAQLTVADLIPRVQVVRGWDAAESGADDGAENPGDRDAPLSPIRSINRLCAQGASPDDE